MDDEKNQTLVSICIPTLNGEKYICEAINSAIAQTYRPLEIIVSDDDSKDETINIIKSYINQTDIPIHIFNHQPAGIGANWNNCVRNSNGEYIKFLFQDDLLEPECVELLMEMALRDKEIGLVFCKRKVLSDEQNEKHLEWVSKFSDLHKNWTFLLPVQSGKLLLKDPKLLSSPRNKVGEPIAVLLKNDVFNKIGYFDERLAQSLDYEFYYRVFTAYKVAFVDKTLATFRIHDEQTTAINSTQKILDYTLYPYLIYQNCFKYLHFKIKIELLKKHHPILKSFSKIFEYV